MALLYSYGNRPTVNTDFDEMQDTVWLAQPFLSTKTFLLEKVVLSMHRTGTVGNVTVSLRATSAGKPTGSDLVSYTFDGDSEIPLDITQHDFKEIDIPLRYDMEKDTTYAIVFRAPDQAVNVVGVKVLDVSGKKLYLGGSYNSSSNSGSSWTIDTTLLFTFKVYGSYKGNRGTQEIAKEYPVVEGLIAHTTKQTGKPNLEPREGGLFNG